MFPVQFLSDLLSLVRFSIYRKETWTTLCNFYSNWNV